MDVRAEDVAASKRLLAAIGEGALLLGATLKAVYPQMQPRRRLFKRATIPESLEVPTFTETWVYVAALLVSLVETWPAKPRSAEAVVPMLESALFEARCLTARPLYNSYRQRYQEREPRDSRVLPREGVIHTLFAQRVATIWELPAERVSTFADTSYAVTQKMEAGLRRVLEEVWPASTGSGT